MERASAWFAAADGRCNALSGTQTTPTQHPHNIHTSPKRHPDNTSNARTGRTQHPHKHPNRTNHHTPG
eukprot:10404641-Lingulodinium_polyedra.AAC.1